MFKKLVSLVILVSLVSLDVLAQTSWGRTDHKGEPWVQNASLPYSISRGLQGRHLALWASHGIYYDQGKGKWRWQRPALFTTCEDLFTQTIVVPYLMPMLEDAGATTYVSGPAAKDYIQTADYEKAGIELIWKDYSGYPDYPQQFSAPFEGAVSILDLLLNTGADAPYYIWSWREQA